MCEAAARLPPSTLLLLPTQSSTPGAPLRPQGLPEGHTRPCYPVQAPGVAMHRVTISRDQEAAALAARRLALVAAATNIRVRGRGRLYERLLRQRGPTRPCKASRAWVQGPRFAH